jgi:hypothetical protein
MISVSRATHGTARRDVPDETERAPGLQHAPISRSRDRVDPVPRLPEHDRIDALVRQTTRSAVPTSVSTPGAPRAGVEHRGIRSTAITSPALGAATRRGQLAGARADVGDPRRAPRSSSHATASAG